MMFADASEQTSKMIHTTVIFELWRDLISHEGNQRPDVVPSGTTA